MSFYAYDLQKLVHPLPPPLKRIDWKGLKSKYVLLEVHFLAKTHL